MPERTSHPPGTISWADLGTTDPDAGKTFYKSLFGWDHEDLPIPDGGTYTMFRHGGRDAAALAQAQEGLPSAWNAYVTVESADEAASKAAELGGTVVADPFDVMDAGRMAVLQDPTGAFFCVWQPETNIGAGVVNEPGALTLSQLNTPDPDRASEFYTELFGWTTELYEGSDVPYWRIDNDERMAGGMMQLSPDMGAPPHWLSYFGIDDVDAAAGRVEELGGRLMIPPTDVPGGRILVAQDPQGAVFGLWTGGYDD